MIYTINPCPDKITGRFCKWVKPVDSKGDMILTDKDRNSEDYPYFIPENKEFKVSDGTTFDLSDPFQLAEWESIKNAPIIASSRYEKDANGNYKIDGNIKDTSSHPRNGVAELYVDIPGVETAARVSKQKLVFEASKLIFDDPKGAEGRLRITRILGKHMLQNQMLQNICLIWLNVIQIRLFLFTILMILNLDFCLLMLRKIE